MKRRLTILRHGKAAFFDGSGDDFSRPLTQRGIDDVTAAAKRLLANGLSVELVVSSPAARAIATAKLAAGVLGVESIATDPIVYDGNEEDILTAVRAFPDDCKSVLLVGHNPTLSELASFLLPEGGISLPAAGAVSLDFECESWTALQEASATLAFV